MARFTVVLTDQVFPSVELERGLLGEIDAELVLSDGTVEGLAALAPTADSLLNTYLPIDAAMVERLGRCRIIARYGIGIDNIDVAAASRAGIVVTNVPDYSVEEVAVHALALILAVVRRVPAAEAKVRAGGWGLDGLRPIRRLSQLTVGLVGYGKIARRLGDAIRPLAGRLLVSDPYLSPAPGLPELVSLDELVAQSDIVSVHAPLTPETHGLFDAARIGRMRPASFLVNTSRGGLVVLSDVAAALRSGQLAGAALDVFEREPLDAGLIAGVPNLLVTPHMAYYSEESLAESQRKATTQIRKVLTGATPDYPVTR